MNTLISNFSYQQTYLWFGQFCHFSPNLKLFISGSLWFHFCCHFSPKFKLPQFFTVAT
ncbi:hypothetical protein Hanom_Chr02g00105661 [Helianthus anomalus]